MSTGRLTRAERRLRNDDRLIESWLQQFERQQIAIIKAKPLARLLLLDQERGEGPQQRGESE